MSVSSCSRGRIAQSPPRAVYRAPRFQHEQFGPVGGYLGVRSWSAAFGSRLTLFRTARKSDLDDRRHPFHVDTPCSDV